MNLVEQLTQFMYSYPVQHHKKDLLKIVAAGEKQYQDRIAELENELALAKLQNKQDEESGGFGDHIY